MTGHAYVPHDFWTTRDTCEARIDEGDGSGRTSACGLPRKAHTSPEAVRIAELEAALAALRDGYDHVSFCRECGEMSVEHCAKTEGENSDAAKAIEARARVDAILAPSPEAPHAAL